MQATSSCSSSSLLAVRILRMNSACSKKRVAQEILQRYTTRRSQSTSFPAHRLHARAVPASQIPSCQQRRPTSPTHLPSLVQGLRRGRAQVGACANGTVVAAAGGGIRVSATSRSCLANLNFDHNGAAPAPSPATAPAPSLSVNGTISGNHHDETSDNSNSKNRHYPSVVVSSPSSSSPPDVTKKTTPSSDLVVVLDMDECLIHSQFLGEVDYRQYEVGRKAAAERLRSNQETEEEPPATCDSFHVLLSDGDVVHVYQRPHLSHFLQELAEHYAQVHIFTAAMEVYASPVLDVLDPCRNLLQKRFYRESCKVDEELGVYVKDLRSVLHQEEEQKEVEDATTMGGRRINGASAGTTATTTTTSSSPLQPTTTPSLIPHLPFNERRTVLVDNNPLSFLANPSNGILVSNFYDDPHDATLPAVLDLLRQLDGEDDVRPMLDDVFGLKDALKEVVTQNGNGNGGNGGWNGGGGKGRRRNHWT